MMQNLQKILTFDSLKIGYASGRQKNILLPPLSASAGRGELIALIGKNGIGKSTLLRTITGLQEPLGGEISYNGRNILEYSRMELAREVGYISTESIKVSNMSVYDLVALGRFPHTNWTGIIDSGNHNSIMDAIEKTGMSALKNRLVSELSDGERQRAMIARILAQDTDIMIMDEPTAFLDIGSKYEILHLMHLLARESEKTIIFSTHDLNIAMSQSDKIWLILDNKLIEGAPEDLMIDGAFDHLFDSSPVQFNTDDGTFSFRTDDRGTIFVEGDGKLRNWTIKAINRAGFSVSENKTIPFITIPSAANSNWQLTTESNSAAFQSIYELVNRLRRDEKRPI
jgi:iron complex transport system ATP-binding protein